MPTTPACSSIWRAIEGSKCWWPRAAPKGSRWRASTVRRRYPLDVFLPDMLGWAVLSQLKQDPLTRHIPVQIVTLDEDRQHGLSRGAFSFVTKPTTREGLDAALSRIRQFATSRRKRLLVVEDDRGERLSIQELLGHDDIDIVTADTGAAALAALAEQACDCVVLDLRLPDMSGFEVLERLRNNEALRDVPVVVFTGREMSPEEDAQLHALARSVVVKGVESPSGCSTKPPCSFIGSFRISPWRSSACSTACIDPTRICSAGPSSWWTMTCATSSRSAACWSDGA